MVEKISKICRLQTPTKCFTQIENLCWTFISKDYVSWRGTFNMIKSWKDGGYVSSFSQKPPTSSLLLSTPIEMFYATDMQHKVKR